MTRLAALSLLLWLLVTVATAQVPSRGNVFAGYSYARTDLGPPPPVPDQGSLRFPAANVNGWNASLEGRILPHVGIVADVSGHYGTWNFTQSCGFIAVCTLTPQGRVSGSIHRILFGPRVSVSVGKLTPFAQAFIGISRFSGNMQFLGFGKAQAEAAYSLGGGVDYKLVRGIGWRLQTDWIREHFFDKTHGDFRLSAGPLLRF